MFAVIFIAAITTGTTHLWPLWLIVWLCLRNATDTFTKAYCTERR